ncbi:MAG TPA: 50S ribosomal protein L6 [Anaerolineales bacterium]|nr:50S ribosomal protein L6 [Anaerolineae bacterium]HRJ57735.1 50S ribosomal protein L6 [Anaerolineales bacterium]HRK89339.1 50S ribosomal protein L6 [Anaerolineales bacterium]
MSRIGRLPVDIPSGVQVELTGSKVRVKGPKGELQREFSRLIGIAMENNQLKITRNSDNPEERALHGTTRAVLANMIHGVSQGFEVILEVEGVGYRAEMEGSKLALFVGYSHPIKIEPPTGVSFETDAKTRQIKVKGFDKELVGQVAANIRKVRPPEPYHGKGLRYLGERVRRKAGKAGKGAK